ncbi:hypothetical protein ABIB62_003009 [Mucilaginibacter sp. UYP25]|uniref:hypothetical protein n=1 Tax=unclassified Mucilaginibacter TaxID=2617802 RepID=UPI00339AD6F9
MTLKHSIILLSLIFKGAFIVPIALLPAITVYEGNCNVYREQVVNGNQRQETFDKSGVGQIVINESARTISFYLNDKALIKSQSYTTSYAPDGEALYYQTRSEYSIAYIPRKKGFHIIITPNFRPVTTWNEYYISDCSIRH